jgi:hypothetical protein
VSFPASVVGASKCIAAAVFTDTVVLCPETEEAAFSVLMESTYITECQHHCTSVHPIRGNWSHLHGLVLLLAGHYCSSAAVYYSSFGV